MSTWVDSATGAVVGRIRFAEAGIACLKIYDVAQEDPTVAEFVTPGRDGLERKRALTQAGNHRPTTGFDALGDRDLALSREKTDRADLAQI
jgi:hypothetical protein